MRKLKIMHRVFFFYLGRSSFFDFGHIGLFNFVTHVFKSVLWFYRTQKFTNKYIKRITQFLFARWRSRFLFSNSSVQKQSSKPINMLVQRLFFSCENSTLFDLMKANCKSKVASWSSNHFLKKLFKTTQKLDCVYMSTLEHGIDQHPAIVRLAKKKTSVTKSSEALEFKFFSCATLTAVLSRTLEATKAPMKQLKLC